MAPLVALSTGLVVGYRGWILRSGDPTPSRVSAQVRPGVDARLELPGVRLRVPGGAVDQQTTAHLATGGPDLFASLTPEGAAMLQPVGRQVQVDLSGSQPSVPLALQLDVPEGIDPAQLVLLSRHDNRTESMAGTYDPTGRRYTAQLPHLSEFRLVRVDPAKVTEAADKVLGVIGTGLATVWGWLQISGRNALDIFPGPGANTILTWRITTSGGIAPFVGEWHVHGAWQMQCLTN